MPSLETREGTGFTDRKIMSRILIRPGQEKIAVTGNRTGSQEGGGWWKHRPHYLFWSAATAVAPVDPSSLLFRSDRDD